MSSRRSAIGLQTQRSGSLSPKGNYSGTSANGPTPAPMAARGRMDGVQAIHNSLQACADAELKAVKEPGERATHLCLQSERLLPYRPLPSQPSQIRPRANCGAKNSALLRSECDRCGSHWQIQELH